MTKTVFSLLIMLCMLNASTAIVKAQTTDTLSVGMELRVQNNIGTKVFMYMIPNDELKGLPTDTTSFRLYRQQDVVCLLARDDERKDWYYCVFDMDKDKVDRIRKRWEHELERLNTLDDGINCVIAVGMAYSDKPYDYSQLAKKADELMYEDKKRFYEEHPEMKGR